MEIHLSSNNLFYFYSTLAQSVAALIAFLGVFIVFRMQYLDNLISNLDRALDNNTTHFFHESFIGEIDLYNKVEIILKKHESNQSKINEIQETRALISNCRSLREEKNTIRKYFIWPSIFSIATIISSLIGIVFVGNQTEKFSCMPILLVISIVFALILIGMMFYLLFLSLRTEKSNR